MGQGATRQADASNEWATTAVDYLQLVEGVRRGITMLNIQKLKLATYVRQMRRQHPEGALPFPFYVPGGDQIALLVEANLASRPVYMLASPIDPGVLDRFDVQRAGFALPLLPRGTSADSFAIVNRSSTSSRASTIRRGGSRTRGSSPRS